MKDKIEEVKPIHCKIAHIIAGTPFEEYGAFTSSHLRKAGKVLDLIAKELPKPMEECITDVLYEHQHGYNHCLADIKHNLEVE